MSTNMTGAELQTLREGLGLTRDDLGNLCQVAGRTIKHWENGRAGVPGDVAALVAQLESRILQAVAAEICNEAPGLVLVRYRPGDAWRYLRTLYDWLPMAPSKTSEAQAQAVAALHGAMIVRWRAAQANTARAGTMERIVWMDSAAYEVWCQAQGLLDNGSSLSQWAAGQVAAQALPHRGDQPAD